MVDPKKAARDRRYQSSEKGIKARLVLFARRRAQKKGEPFYLFADDIKHLPTHCPICKVELVVGKGKARDNSYTLDKIDPLQLYTPDNIAIICRRCNVIKSEGRPEEHIRIAKWQRKVSPKETEVTDFRLDL